MPQKNTSFYMESKEKLIIDIESMCSHRKDSKMAARGRKQKVTLL
jgi:hypothetical protein